MSGCQRHLAVVSPSVSVCHKAAPLPTARRNQNKSSSSSSSFICPKL